MKTTIDDLFFRSISEKERQKAKKRIQDEEALERQAKYGEIIARLAPIRCRMLELVSDRRLAKAVLGFLPKPEHAWVDKVLDVGVFPNKGNPILLYLRMYTKTGELSFDVGGVQLSAKQLSRPDFTKAGSLEWIDAVLTSDYSSHKDHSVYSSDRLTPQILEDSVCRAVAAAYKMPYATRNLHLLKPEYR